MDDHQTFVDQATDVRQGEGLDQAALEAYLQANTDEIEGPITVKQFPGGHSNLTYLIVNQGKEWVLRRPPFGREIKSAHDMGREYRVLSHIVDVYPQVPRPLILCDDPEVIGAPFYVMERLQGVILRKRAPEGLDLNADVMKTLSENFVDNLITIHSIDVEKAGLDQFGHPEGYVRRQIEGWTKRYHAARTDEIQTIEQVARWLDENQPGETGAGLIHNDYKYDNMVLDPDDLTRIVGVLDWEMSTYADPMMDLGSTLAYWVDADDPPVLQMGAFGLTNLPGNLTRREIAERYAQTSGQTLDHLVFYYVYGLFKLAVIAQQIYARYAAGHSQDKRFAAMIDAVRMLGEVGTLAIDKSRIDNLQG